MRVEKRRVERKRVRRKRTERKRAEGKRVRVEKAMLVIPQRGLELLQAPTAQPAEEIMKEILRWELQSDVEAFVED